jgi:hypothetical protein
MAVGMEKRQVFDIPKPGLEVTAPESGSSGIGPAMVAP